MAEQSGSHLNLWKKRLGQVPKSTWEHTGLETLVLADNELSEVSGQIGRLKSLRMLDLGHNQLTSVPEALADLDALTDFLYLHDNRLTLLPSSLEGIPWRKHSCLPRSYSYERLVQRPRKLTSAVIR